MIGTLLIIAKYLYDDFLVMYFYQRVLGRKYSVEITIGATIVWWLSQCISKLAVWLGIRLVMVEILQYWGLISYLLYGVLVYKSAIRQRILAVVMIVILSWSLFATDFCTSDNTGNILFFNCAALGS